MRFSIQYSAGLVLFVFTLGSPLMGQVTRMESVTNGGNAAMANCHECDVSGNGRFISFETEANLGVGTGGRGVVDRIYLRDHLEQTTTFVGIGDGFGRSTVSDDGDVAFKTVEALVPADTNGAKDIYVRDFDTGTYELVSVDSFGVVGNAFSACPTISDNSRYVAFDSRATNLVPGDTNDDDDVFRHDRQTGTTIRVSVDNSGNQVTGDSVFPAISGDGRYVVFGSRSTDLVAGDVNGQRDLYRHDCDTNENILVSQSTAGVQGDADAGFGGASSADGQTIVFQSVSANFVAGDTNGVNDIFVRHVASGITERVSVDAFGVETLAGTSNREPDISGDGSTVVFISNAVTLVPGDSNGGQDAFIKDIGTGAIEIATQNTYGEQQNFSTNMLGVHASTDGQIVVFDTSSTNLHRGTPDARSRIFWRNRATTVQLTSVTPDRGAWCGDRQINILGTGFTTVEDTVVWFDWLSNLDRTATVVSVDPGRIVIRVPSGGVGAINDIVVSCSSGGGGLRDSFEYLWDYIDCRFGNTNIAAGTLEDVLTINGSPGVGDERIVSVGLSQPFSMDMAVPSSRISSRFVLYAYSGEPTALTAAPLGFDLGLFSFTLPFLGGTPVAIWNNFGHQVLLGDPDFPSDPAPTQVFSSGGLNQPRTVTFQAIIQDDNARVSEGASISNAVVLKVE